MWEQRSRVCVSDSPAGSGARELGSPSLIGFASGGERFELRTSSRKKPEMQTVEQQGSCTFQFPKSLLPAKRRWDAHLTLDCKSDLTVVPDGLQKTVIQQKVRT